MSAGLEAVVAGLAAAPKYRDLAPETLERMARWALVRHERPADALKAAKRKLHQAFGAYLDPTAVPAAHRVMDRLSPRPAPEEIAAAARRILALHRSAAERLPVLVEYYAAITEAVGPPACVLDIAAGLNPFALPFMGLPVATRYVAVEVDRGLVGAAERFLALAERPGEAVWADVLVRLPEAGADLALVLKSLPCLEQQEPGAGQALLRRLEAVPRIVVSWPVRSLGGRDKGMVATYTAEAEALAEAAGRPMTRLAIESELVFLLGPATAIPDTGRRPVPK